MPVQISEADIIFSRASVALARSQRLIASWLPPQSPSELANAKSEEEIEKEEQEIFKPEPELEPKLKPETPQNGRLGLGATVPKEDEIKRLKADTDEKLRRQLMGKEYKKLDSIGLRNGYKTGPVMLGGPKPRPVPAKQAVVESDDEGGRSSLGKSKRQRLDEPVKLIQDKNSSASTCLGQGQRRTNYLDEVLAERSQKKRKKSKKRPNSSPGDINPTNSGESKFNDAIQLQKFT